MLSIPKNVYQVEYIWIGGNKELRSKSKTVYLNKKIELKDLSIWNFDGSSTKQAEESDTEILIKPQALFKDPFRLGGFLVLCDTYKTNGEPHKTNKRYNAVKIFEKYKEQVPMYGLEQEFFLMKPGTKIPLSFPSTNGQLQPQLGPQGPYYCSVGSSKCYHREIIEEFYNKALYTGLKISGINAEVAPSQWEFQVGPCIGIEEGDHLWLSRYILERICEKYNCDVCYDPKPLKGDWNGSGCHTNFSTLKMREKNGLKHIINAVNKLSENHKEMISIYGDEDNKERLTGRHETGNWEKFTYGYGTRNTTVRIGNDVKLSNKGYFEIRAVSSNIDPYYVTSEILKNINNK